MNRTRVGAAVRAALTGLVAEQRGRTAEPAGVIRERCGRKLQQTVRVTVALSGGLDSMVLVDACANLRAELPIAVDALHVHHGLSPHADAWADFCVTDCARRGIPLRVERVRVERRPGQSLEAAARAVRYEAFAAAPSDAILLAHHADDQAETVLLQLLRGAGVHGLAAMPDRRRSSHGPCLLRPLLGLDRATLRAYAASRALAWIEDESNDDRRLRRNFLRHEVTPRLATAFPGYPATLLRSARHLGEAAALLDELARIDAGLPAELPAVDHARGGRSAPSLARATLSAVARRSPARARNLLRWFLREQGLVAASTARLAAMLEQLAEAAPDARVRLLHDGREIGIHRGDIVVHARAPEPFVLPWKGEVTLVLPHGVVEFAVAAGEGLAAAALCADPVTVRSRTGGELLLREVDRPPSRLKRLLHDAGVAPWDRAALPLVFCGETLVGVPGIGIDPRYRAAAGAPGLVLHWHPQVDPPSAVAPA